MAEHKPTIVIVSTHPILRSLLERHGEHAAKVVSVPDIAEFERRTLALNPSVLILDEGTGNVIPELKRLRKRFSPSALRIVVLCAHLSHDHMHNLHAALVDDILLTTHHTPRDIMARLLEMIDV